MERSPWAAAAAGAVEALLVPSALALRQPGPGAGHKAQNGDQPIRCGFRPCSDRHAIRRDRRLVVKVVYYIGRYADPFLDPIGWCAVNLIKVALAVCGFQLCTNMPVPLIANTADTDKSCIEATSEWGWVRIQRYIRI